MGGLPDFLSDIFLPRTPLCHEEPLKLYNKSSSHPQMIHALISQKEFKQIKNNLFCASRRQKEPSRLRAERIYMEHMHSDFVSKVHIVIIFVLKISSFVKQWQNYWFLPSWT